MIDSGVFSYINVLNKAADASWTRNEVLANNMANSSTPNYKRQDVTFETYLQSALLGSKAGTTEYNSLDKTVKNLNLNTLNSTTYTDMATLSYRQDGNNVSMETEQAELASNQIRYQALTDSMTAEFDRIKSVLS